MEVVRKQAGTLKYGEVFKLQDVHYMRLNMNDQLSPAALNWAVRLKDGCVVSINLENMGDVTRVFGNFVEL